MSDDRTKEQTLETEPGSTRADLTAEVVDVRMEPLSDVVRQGHPVVKFTGLTPDACGFLGWLMADIEAHGEETGWNGVSGTTIDADFIYQTCLGNGLVVEFGAGGERVALTPEQGYGPLLADIRTFRDRTH